MNDPCEELVVRLGKAQVDAMFERQDKGPLMDDSEFVPLVESVLTAFETVGIDGEVVEELWRYAYSRYDRACQEADPNFTTAENLRLMRGYLLGPRRICRLSEGVMMTSYVEESDEEMRAKSNRTFRRIVASLPPAVAERYGYVESEIDPLRERLDAAVANQNWTLASQIDAELGRRDDRAG